MIVVTTPTGLIGHQVVGRLLEAGAPVRVIARDPSRLPEAVRAQVEVFPGSHGDRAVLDEAFSGASSVFWLVPPDPRATSVHAAFVDFTRPAVDTWVAHGVPRVVGISALGRGTPVAAQAGYVTGSLAMDDLIAGSGVSYRALVCPTFMDNVTRQATLIREQGVFTTPLPGEDKRPTCATRDIAAVAATLLLAEGWSGVEEVPVLGPEDLSYDEMARIAGDVTERPIRYQQTSAEAYRATMIEAGLSDAMAQGMVDMALAKASGLDNGVTRSAAYSTPATFREWCADTLRPLVLGHPPAQHGSAPVARERERR
ncbi:NmrA family NAD(P)-binding protein [Amycolatopsis sp. NBC_01480]|uniref:NmrA family NAD(P)-binding protein n=1 Tax=Amycolatopsis sp. NBC_01480 TaxID=2903562 RepID=UPI002E2C8A66|nr:NAD(P)H-binding protein [Amycolatopsis sp. NBC_01480]